MKIGVVGCGAISEEYFSHIASYYPEIELSACSATNLKGALRKAEKYHMKACTFEEILENPEIEVVLVLTPQETHYELIRKALLAGKHTYTEKMLAGNTAQARELISLAEERGLCLGCAPDTFMSSGMCLAKGMIDSGKIGEVTGFSIAANRDLSFLASKFRFLRAPGSGICADYGVYFLTALVYLLGEVADVTAFTGNPKRIRINSDPESPEYGQEYLYENESQVQAILTMRSGIRGTMLLNGDSIMPDLAEFKIYGTKGILCLGNVNQYGDSVTLIPYDRENPAGTAHPEVIRSNTSDRPRVRGIGLADMIHAIEMKTGFSANAKLGYQVMKIAEKITAWESEKTEESEA